MHMRMHMHICTLHNHRMRQLTRESERPSLLALYHSTGGAGHWRRKDVPMSNLYLGLLQQFGAQRDRFGESAGAFDLLA